MISQITYRSFQLFLLITCVKIATALLSEIHARKRVNEFRHKLENTNWDFSDQANNANDPNTASNIFIDKYTGLFDACVTPSGNLGLQRAYLGQSIRKISYISNIVYRLSANLRRIAFNDKSTVFGAEIIDILKNILDIGPSQINHVTSITFI